MKKYVYSFINGRADGSASMNNLLGGKGANLAEMTNLGIPVPPGFTITTEVCVYYMKYNKYPPELKKQVAKAISQLESFMNKKFGDIKNPLLFSVRSGACQSMPGMMETVLNIGLNYQTANGLIKKTKNPTFVYDSLRRLMMMYSDVVMEKSNSKHTNQNGIRTSLESLLDERKSIDGCIQDSELSEKALSTLCSLFEKKIEKTFDVPFPQNAEEQLWGAIDAVFQSWNGKRAIDYRNIEKIPHSWGTAVNVQCMVFGNMGEHSATGVAFTRNPSTGEKYFFGEWLRNAQGEDVVAGIRTPRPILNNSQDDLKTQMPRAFKKLDDVQKKLEQHYKEMQDLEFTIENNKLWILQTRTGKRNGIATIQIALDMYKEKLHSEDDMINKIKPEHINELLLPMIDENKIKDIIPIGEGLPAGPGCATGQVFFSPDEAEKQFNNGLNIILVREETSPEDVHGMFVSNAILTSRGGMTSHAALVARGWGKCCIVGCTNLTIDMQNKSAVIDNHIIHEGDWITLNGSKGLIYNDQLPLIQPVIKTNTLFNKLLQLIKKNQSLSVRTNADQPQDAQTALDMGAEGIGLCRTEHMFFNPERIRIIRQMILAPNSKERRIAIMKLLPYQKKDFYNILKTMDSKPVTIRLLDPPLHEFLPNTKEQIQELAKEFNLTIKKVQNIVDGLHELNPMLGHRGCRLGITFPEITAMQTQAIMHATIQLYQEGLHPKPEIMIPLVGSLGEFINQKNIVVNEITKLVQDTNIKTNSIKIGTMIELPRACLIANLIAKHADFLSFGTNDLTQTTFGFSRDDIGSFLPEYLNQDILDSDPFQHLDEQGVGELIILAIQRARKVNKKIKIGICGEHGGDPQSIHFLATAGVDYVSCSPYRVPIAALTLAQLKR